MCMVVFNSRQATCVGWFYQLITCPSQLAAIPNNTISKVFDMPDYCSHVEQWFHV